MRRDAPPGTFAPIAADPGLMRMTKRGAQLLAKGVACGPGPFDAGAQPPIAANAQAPRGVKFTGGASGLLDQRVAPAMHACRQRRAESRTVVGEFCQ